MGSLIFVVVRDWRDSLRGWSWGAKTGRRGVLCCWRGHALTAALGAARAGLASCNGLGGDAVAAALGLVAVVWVLALVTEFLLLRQWSAQSRKRRIRKLISHFCEAFPVCFDFDSRVLPLLTDNF